MENRQLHTRSAQAHADGRPLLQLQNLTIAGGVVNFEPRPVATGKRQHEDSERCPAPRINKRQRLASKSLSPAPRPEPPVLSAETTGRTPTATPGPQFEAGYCPTPGNNTVLTRAARRAQKKQQQRRGQQAQRQQQTSAATSPVGNAPPSQPPLTAWPHQPQHQVASAAVVPFGASASDWNFAPAGPPVFAPQPPAAAPAAPIAFTAPQMGQQQQQQQQQSPVSVTMPPPAAQPATAPVPMAPPPQRRSTGPRRTATPEAPATARTRGRSAAPENNDNGGDSSGGDSGSTTPTRPQQRQLRSVRTRGSARQAPATPSGASGNVAKILDIMRQQLNMRGRDIVDISLKLHSYSEEQLQLTEGTLQLLLEEEEWDEAATYLRRLP